MDTNGNDVTFAAALTGAGGLTKIGDGTLTLTAADTYTGVTVVGGGTLSFDAGALNDTAGIVFLGGSLQWHGAYQEDVSAVIWPIANDRSAILDTNGNDVTFHAALNGDGGLTKEGDGVVMLSAANTYSGDTVIGGGTLQIGNTNALATSAFETRWLRRFRGICRPYYDCGHWRAHRQSWLVAYQQQ